MSWGAQFICTMWLGLRANETMAQMLASDLSLFKDDVFDYEYYAEVNRGPTKNHFDDLEELANAKIIPFFWLSEGFNPGMTVNEYLGYLG